MVLVDSLIPGTSYTFVIQAVQGLSTSDYSTPPVVSIPNPASPSSLTATSGINSVILNWSSVSGANGYKISYGTSTSYGTDVLVSNGSTTSYTISQLTPNVNYYFAISTLQNGVYSTPKSIDNPVQPTIISLSKTSEEPLILTWNNDSAATTYKVFSGITENTLTETSTLPFLSTSASSTSATILGLDGSTSYIFEVRAIYSDNSTNNSSRIQSLGCFLADSKVLTDKGLIAIQLLKKGDLVQTLNDGLLPIKFVGKLSFFNQLTEERINAHLYKLNKNDFPKLLEDLFITGGHPLLVDKNDLDEETKKKLLVMSDDSPIITEGKYRVFAFIHPKAELWNDEGMKEVFDIVLENEDPHRNYGIWVNGILTESMDEHFFLNYSGMKEI